MWRIIDALIPERFTSPAAKRACAVALLLFPAALIAGFFLQLKTTPAPPVQAAVDRAGALTVARQFLIRQGFPGAASWQGSCGGATAADVLSFAGSKPSHRPVWKVAPPISATCRFHAPGREIVDVFVSVDGGILGFDGKKALASGPELTDAQTLSLAAARLPAGLHFDSPTVDRNNGRRTYTFRSYSLPDSETRAEATVEGSHLTSFIVKVEPDDSFSAGGFEWIQTALSSLGGLFVAVVAIFSIYRYAHRTLQQEVSHRRSLIVAALCGIFCVLCGRNSQVQTEGMEVPGTLILVVFAIFGTFCGGLVAAAYGSGEGDVREAFPGSLTSLDTLLTGRLFSRNIGVSVLFGLACAGWALLLNSAVSGLFAGGEEAVSQALMAPFISLYWLTALVTSPLLALCYAAAGLLQPLAYLNRYLAQKRRWHFPALIVSAGLVSMLRTHARTPLEFLLSSGVFVGALLLPFFLRDLFASLVCITVLSSSLEMVANLAAVPAYSLRYVAIEVAAIAGSAIFAVVCVRRGREFTEEEVRPLYARHIAERKSLEAEVSAAREAQLRLLPESVPDLAGLHISAACVPAETVGGDFYDFFPLGDRCLGVFIAEGNKRGLAAALTIALAKGYLMQCVERFREPVEILSRLEIALASIFERESVATDFAFAAIDTVAGELRYARTGSYPKVVVVSAAPAGSDSSASERMVQVKGRGSPIAEGRARLAPGDHVVLFTDGMGRRLAGGNRRPEEAAAALVASSAHKSAEEIREKFFSSTKASLDPDDLTVVVIHMQALAERERDAVLGVVA